MTTFIHFLLGPTSPPMLHLMPPPRRTHHRTPPIPTTAMTLGVSFGSGGQPRTVIPRQLRKMASLRSTSGSLKPPFKLPRKRPVLVESGWPSPTPWWRVRWILEHPHYNFHYLYLDGSPISVIASPDGAVGVPLAGDERGYECHQCSGSPHQRPPP